ncbi:MAG: carbohydrate-binding domain-containing protein, partial [Phormidesmis sp.]
DIQATADVGGGFNVGWIRNGEWLTYDLDVLESGSYNIVARVASAKSSPHSLSVSAGGETAQISFGATGGWQSWQDVVVGNVSLSAGAQQLRVDMPEGSFNLNYLELAPV